MEKLLIQAMTYDSPAQLPVSISFLPRAWLSRHEELAAISLEYPDLLPPPPPGIEAVRAGLPESYRMGSWVDEWGCVWTNVEEGMEAIVTGHPVPERGMIAGLEIPALRTGRLPHGLMYLRLLDLRGFEEAMIDFAEECEELDMLIGKVLAYNLIQTDIFLRDNPDSRVIYFGDDLGMQNGLAIGPEKWRRYIGPCFAQLFARVKAAGRYAYLHTDGMIWEILPDLRAAGVDMVNPQFRANGLDNLARVCRGKIPINLDLDRQLFPFATPSQLDDHVRECVEALYLPEGGLGLNVELNYEVPTENIVAILDALRKYR